MVWSQTKTKKSAIRTFLIHPASDRAKSVRIKSVSLKRSFPPHRSLDGHFPFNSMQVGEAFHMYHEECGKPELTLCKNRVAWLNRVFAVKFLVLEHQSARGRYREIARVR
jgi:hypothetical protein